MGIKRKIGDLSRRIDTKWAIEVREIEDEIENGLFSETKQVKNNYFVWVLNSSGIRANSGHDQFLPEHCQSGRLALRRR